MGYRKPGAAEQIYFIIKYKVRGAVKALRLRLKLWRKPKSDCCGCCLFCKYFERCSSEMEAENGL